MADHFELKFRIGEEPEYENDLKDKNQSFKVIRSDMELVSEAIINF